MQIKYKSYENRILIPDRQEEIPLNQLRLEHREVKKKKVRRYVGNFQNEEPIDPLVVIYCEETQAYYLANGHHRIFAAHLLGIESLLAEIDICPHRKIGGHTHHSLDKTFSVENMILE